jgi:hypothetical protein
MGLPKRRAKTQRPERAAWLILCEGHAEKGYFQRFRSRSRAVKLHFDISPGNPKAMVEKGIRRWKASRSQHDFDRVWCVVDADNHETELLENAGQIAAGCPGVELVLSNPCIELWALLHFQDQTAWISREAAQKALHDRHCPGYLPKKCLPTQQLFELENDALERARKLTPGANPSTGIPDLIEALLAEGRRRD